MANRIESTPADEDRASSVYPDRTIRVVQAGAAGSGCVDAVGTLGSRSYDIGPQQPLLSAARPGPCADAARLVVLPRGAIVTVGSQVSPEVSEQGGFALVAFGPEACSVAPPAFD